MSCFFAFMTPFPASEAVISQLLYLNYIIAAGLFDETLAVMILMSLKNI